MRLESKWAWVLLGTLVAEDRQAGTTESSWEEGGEQMMREEKQRRRGERESEQQRWTIKERESREGYKYETP